MKIGYQFEMTPEEFQAEQEAVTSNIKTGCETVLSIIDKLVNLAVAEKQTNKIDMLKYAVENIENRIDQAINKVETIVRNNSNNSNNGYKQR